MNETELDRQLQMALHEECAPESVARLEHYWRRQRRDEARRRMLRRCTALAAALAMLAGAIALLTWNKDQSDSTSVIVEARPESPRVWQKSLSEGPALSTLSAGREPTAYEALMFTAQVRRDEAAKTSLATKSLDAAIEQLAADPTLAVDQLAEAARLNSADVESALLRRLPRANQADAVAMIRLLDRFGTDRSAAALMVAAREPSLRSQAIDALERIGGEDGLVAAIFQSNNSDVRRAIVVRLLGNGAESSLRRCLAMVGVASIRADVLAAADALESPPTSQLLAMLKDDDQATRLSSAIVLGHMNGPQVTAGLIAIVTEDPAAPPEAWLALLACRDESAVRFLADAALHPRLLGQVNNARMTWARMVQ
jgi:hypothetical protein